MMNKKRKWLPLLRGIILLIVLLVSCPITSLSIASHPVKAAAWAGWVGISNIYYNPAQEDANNPFLQTAAQELETYLERISGRAWTITTTLPASPAIYLYVNATQLAGHGDEASRLVIDSNGVTITGKTALATLEGSYKFLNNLGVKWFFKSDVWTVVPTSLSALSASDTIQEPDYVFRRIQVSSAVNITATNLWNQRNCIWGAGDYEASHSYASILSDAGYSMSANASRAAVFSAHPEWLMPTNPDSDYWPWQLNPLNSTILEMSTNYTRSLLSAAPSKKSFSPYVDSYIAVPVSPNDGGGWALPYVESAAGSQNITDSVFTLVKNVADNISADYPGKYVSCYVYSWYSRVPSFSLPSNVMVEIATGYNYGGLTLNEQVSGYNAKGVLVGLRDYLDVWDWFYDKIPEYAATAISHIKTYTGQAKVYNAESGDGWCARAGLSNYLLSQLTWDSSLNIDDILNDFYTKAFGSASSVMKTYYGYRGYTTANLTNTFDLLHQADVILTANGDSASLARVRELEYYNRYLWKYGNVGLASLTNSDLESFYTFVTKLKNLYIIWYTPIEAEVKAQLTSRGYSSGQITALQNFTPPTASEAIGWMNEGLIRFVGGNFPPTISPIGNKTTHPGWPLQFNVSATDPNGDNITYSAANLPPWASFNPATHVFSGTANQTGTYNNVQFTVSDNLLTNSENITITSTVNQAPVLTNPGTKSVNEGATLQFTVSATDPDGDILTYSANNTPSGTSLNPATGIFSWTPSYTQAGIYNNVSVKVTDGELSDTKYFNITVVNVNQSPVLSAIGNKSVTENQLLNFTVSAADIDGDTLTYSASNLPTGASFNSTSHVFAWMPTSSQIGSYGNIRFTVSDGALSVNETITITVGATPSNPPSGGGGGGGGGSGGGGGGGSPAGITNIRGSQTVEGRMTEDVSAEDIYLNVKLKIAKGTIVKNRLGQTVSSIRITPKTDILAENTVSQLISRPFEIEPSGTTFAASAILSFKYSSTDLPEGVPDNNLFIALWDPDTMTWQDLGGAVDISTRTVSVNIQHLSIYALMARTRPASFKIAKLALSTGEVSPNENITANIIISNQGDLPGTYKIDLMLDNVSIQNKEISVKGGSEETISFALASDIIGEHQASIGDIKTSFLVKKPLLPATFKVDELNVTPLQAKAGENIDIAFLVKNTGDLAGNYLATLTVDDIDIETREVNINGGDSAIVIFSYPAESVGLHKASAGGFTAPFEVMAPAALLPPPANKQATKPEFSSFSTSPVYAENTNTLIYTKTVFQMNDVWDAFSDTKLMLTVFFDGQYLEQVALFKLSELQPDGKTGILSYVPAAGWQSGEYAFRAELYQEDVLIQDTPLRKISITPESMTRVISWKILGIIIGGVFVLGALIITLVLYYRRDMLRDYWK